jgi:peptidoglycan/xylan/chitin deacetylase (PgdA/CDA1 family)
VQNLAYKSLLVSTGLIGRALRLYKPTILCFHSVSSHATPISQRGQMSVDADFLDRLARRLEHLGIPILSLEDAMARLRGRRSDPFVVLTFDDGYRDNYTNLYPVAVRHRMPFTIFVTSGLIDRQLGMWWEVVEQSRKAGLLTQEVEARLLRNAGEGRYRCIDDAFRNVPLERQRTLLAELRRMHPDLPDPYDMALTWDMLREMQSSGLLTVGAHSVHHPLMARLSPDAILAELKTSRQRIEAELGAPVCFAAYPFGQKYEVGTVAPAMARALGFDGAFSTEGRPLNDGDIGQRHWLPRVLLGSKAQHVDIVTAYICGLPARLNQLFGRTSRA